MHRLIRVLAHLPVGAKLWLGFGLVLLSTLGVAAIAFQSIGLLQARDQQTRARTGADSCIAVLFDQLACWCSKRLNASTAATL